MSSETRRLAEDASRGDSKALGELLERHLPGLYAFVRVRTGPLVRAKESCSDLVQSACREVLQDLDPNAHADEKAFKRWLYAAALRKIVDRARFYRAGRRDAAREVSLDAADRAGLADLYRTMATPSRAAMSNEAFARFEAALGRLSEDHREVIVLSRLAGLSHAEIARHMERSEEATRQLLTRALARLTTLLGSWPED